jgi:hypothetical protein
MFEGLSSGRCKRNCLVDIPQITPNRRNRRVSSFPGSWTQGVGGDPFGGRGTDVAIFAAVTARRLIPLARR